MLQIPITISNWKWKSIEIRNAFEPSNFQHSDLPDRGPGTYARAYAYVHVTSTLTAESTLTPNLPVESLLPFAFIFMTNLSSRSISYMLWFFFAYAY